MADFQTPPNVNNLTISPWRLLGRLFKSTGRSIVTAPAHLGLKGWALAALVILSTAISYIEKAPLRSVFVGSSAGNIEFFAEIGRQFGDGPTVVVLVAVLLMVGFALKKRIVVETGVVLAVAGLWCGALTTLGQFIFAEARPCDGGKMAFFVLHGHGVSGHASSAAVIFWPLYSVLGSKLSKIRQILLSVLLLAWAFFVAWSRMWDNMHFLWNVILGMSVGLSVGYAAVMEWKKFRQLSDDERPSNGD